MKRYKVVDDMVDSISVQVSLLLIRKPCLVWLIG